MSDIDALIEKLNVFEKCAIELATGKGVEYEEYESKRYMIMEEPEIVAGLPEWVIRCRWGSKFWYFIKEQSTSYQGRREYIWQTLGETVEFLRSGGNRPSTISLNAVLENCSSDVIAETWRKIHNRSRSDIEGSITAARALVESTCKYILDRLEISYDGKDDLPRLYKKAAKELHLSPNQHSEQIFLQILSGCGSVIGGFASLRNEFGDAHGKGRDYKPPSKRHADLAINLAGSICAFLISTFEDGHSERDS